MHYKKKQKKKTSNQLFLAKVNADMNWDVSANIGKKSKKFLPIFPWQTQMVEYGGATVPTEMWTGAFKPYI
jgi:hypothetical protein